MREEEDKIEKFVFDSARAATVNRELAEAWEKRTFGFANLHPPELRHLPEGIKPGSLMAAKYFFFVGWNQRSGKTAEEAIRQCKEVCLQHPEVLDPSIALRPDFRPKLDEILIPVIPFATHEPERVQWWVNTLEMLEQYDGDPRTLILSIMDLSKDPLEVRKDIIRVLINAKNRKKPVGMQHKIAQLILLWIQFQVWEGNEKEWEFFKTIPFYCVDIWVMRLAYQFGMITEYSTDKRDSISKRLSDKLSENCYENGISWYNANQAIWHIGNAFCQWRPKNSNLEAERHCALQCPLYELCLRIVPANVENHSRGALKYDLAKPHPELDLGTIHGVPLREFARQQFASTTGRVIFSGSDDHSQQNLIDPGIIPLTEGKNFLISVDNLPPHVTEALTQPRRHKREKTYIPQVPTSETHPTLDI